MRFNITALILASGLASAVTTAPPVVMEGNNTSCLYTPTHLYNLSDILTNSLILVLQLNKAIVESNQLPPNCNLGSCLNLGGEITCIASAAASGDAVALQKCLANSISQVGFSSFHSFLRLPPSLSIHMFEWVLGMLIEITSCAAA